MNRLLTLLRIQFLSWRLSLALPLGLLALILGINLAIFASIGDAVPPEGRTTGALMSIYIIIGVGYLQSMTQLFPFVLGLGVTRRAFYSATALLAVVEAVCYGALMLLFSLVERATGGWGLGLKFFAIDLLVVDDPLLQWLVYSVPFVATAALGIFNGVVFKRWGQVGAYAVTVAFALVLAAAVLLVSWQGWWPAVGAWFAGQGTTALFGVYPLLLALLLGGAGWLAIRGTTP